MSDNVFDRLMELLQSPGPVNWRLAREGTASLSGAGEPIEPHLSEQYIELTHAAQLHVGRASGLPLGPAADDINPVDRRTWAESNLEGFDFLVGPMADKMKTIPTTGPFDAILQPLGPAILGMQVGTMVGFMSHRILGQFDIGLPVVGRPGIYFIVPNVEAFAADHAIDPPQARLWMALHEVTNQAEFAVPWVTPHFTSLISSYFAGLEFDPGSLTERLESLQSQEDLESAFSEPGAVFGITAGPEQQQVLAEIQAFMAFIEGYADNLMDRAAPDLIPETPRIREALNRRRAEPSEGEQFLQRMMGLELKRDQYRLGSRFSAEVIRRWGEDKLAGVWEGPEYLPTLAELEDPVGWAARQL